MGRRRGAAARVARVRGARHHQQRLGGDARAARWLTRPRSRARQRDLENGFGDTPEDVVETARGAIEAGLAGFSIEDFSGREDDPIYPIELAAERVAAAAEVAHGGPARLVLTARCENHIRGRDQLEDTIARLQAYERAGADVLFAPGVRTAEEISALVAAVGKPVNVLAMAGVPPVDELGRLGVARISVGGAFAFAGLAAVTEAARELRERGTYGYLEATVTGAKAARAAFGAGS